MQQPNDLILMDFSEGEKEGEGERERERDSETVVEVSSMLWLKCKNYLMLKEHMTDKASTMYSLQDGCGEGVGGAGWRRPRHARAV